MNNKKEITMDDLKDLLLDNEITNFDPVAEAFKVFDPTGDGTLNGAKLREVTISKLCNDLSFFVISIHYFKTQLLIKSTIISDINLTIRLFWHMEWES